jgi:two-component system, response regulator PdtaR
MGGLAGSKVLVVEDEFVLAINYQVLLWRLGCKVLGPAASVAEALVLLRHERPDAALLDVRLADGRATPVAEALRAAGVPFVLVTACGPAELPEPTLGGARRLDKTCGEAALRAAVAGMLAAA